jgi:uncharacterized protein (UPF0335 family)
MPKPSPKSSSSKKPNEIVDNDPFGIGEEAQGTKPAGKGHNNPPPDDGEVISLSSDKLKAFVGRIERLEEDKAAVNEDIKEVYAEAKGAGFDTKIIKQVVKMKAQDENVRREQAELLSLYALVFGIEV